jgi:hypothetical protein
LRWESARAEALAALAPRLAELGCPKPWPPQGKSGKIRARQGPDRPGGAPAGTLPEALAAAREIKDAARADALTALAERLPELCPKPWPPQGKSRDEIRPRRGPDRPGGAPAAGTLPEALAAAREIEDAVPAPALTALAERLPPELLPEALAAAREIKDAMPAPAS